MERLRAAQQAWTQVEPRMRRFAWRATVWTSLTLAAPFLALAFLLFLLDVPFLWIAVAAGAGALIVVGGLCAFLVVRARLRAVGERIAQARRTAEWLLG